MLFFHPQLQLTREIQLDMPDAYYLHVITLCPRTSFRANGHEVVGFHVENTIEGSYKIKVKVLQDMALPDLEYITPVVHTLFLGSIVFQNGHGLFEVQVVANTIEPEVTNVRGRDTGTPKTGGTGTVGSTTADDKSRPIDFERL